MNDLFAKQNRSCSKEMWFLSLPRGVVKPGNGLAGTTNRWPASNLERLAIRRVHTAESEVAKRILLKRDEGFGHF
jgi:hypothetical protein